MAVMNFHTFMQSLKVSPVSTIISGMNVNQFAKWLIEVRMLDQAFEMSANILIFIAAFFYSSFILRPVANI